VTCVRDIKIMRNFVGKLERKLLLERHRDKQQINSNVKLIEHASSFVSTELF
jgi:hypothetical protein